jgi:hypothetical protein
MESDIRPDLEEFMHLYDRLIICARIIDGGQTEHECNSILYFVKETASKSLEVSQTDDSA